MSSIQAAATVFPCTFLGTYLWAVYLDHADSVWPYISDTGGESLAIHLRHRWESLDISDTGGESLDISDTGRESLDISDTGGESLTATVENPRGSVEKLSPK